MTEPRREGREDAPPARSRGAVVRTLDIAPIEDSLRAAHEQFATGFDQAAIGMVLTHPSGEILRVNAAFCEMLGRTEQDLLESSWESITHPDHLGAERDFVQAALSGRDQKMRAEQRYIRGDGTLVPVLITSSLMTDDDGRALFFFTQVNDIIELKTSQDELRDKASLVELLQAVAVASNDASSIEEAFEIAVEHVCAHMSWPIGHVYVAEDGKLVPAKIWHLSDRNRFSSFRHATQSKILEVGEGLPGRVFEAARPMWVEDVTRDDLFTRGEAARAIGMGAAFAFPVPTKDGIAAVLEFFYTEARTPNAPLLEVMGHIGKLLGQRVEREQMESALRAGEERMGLIIETANDAFVGMDEEGRITDWNRQAMTLFGWSRSEILGRLVADTIIPERFREAHWRGLRHFFATGEGPVLNRPVELTALHRDGRELPVELTVWPIHVGDGYRFNAFIHDIRERKQAEEALQEANLKLTKWVGELEQRNREIVLLNEMIEMLQSCHDSSEAYAAVARFVQKLFPTESGALCVPTSSHSLVEAVTTWGDYPARERVFAVDECWALRRGRMHIVEDPDTGLVCPHVTRKLETGYMCAPLMAQGEVLGVLHLQHGAPDPDQSPEERQRSEESERQLAVSVTEQVSMTLANLKLLETRERLRVQSLRDPLTGLFNRRYLEESLDRELRRAARSQRPLGIIMLDVDHFKTINDTHGHDAGDTMLRAIGDFLSSRVRGEDIACRYGGEEFLLILPEAPLEVTTRRAEQLWREINDLTVTHGRKVLGPVTLSLGVAVFPQHGSTSDPLLRAADTALYRAKETGRNRVEIAD